MMNKHQTSATSGHSGVRSVIAEWIASARKRSVKAIWVALAGMFCVLLPPAIAAGATPGGAQSPGDAFKVTTVYLVRHAEKAAQPPGDPPLLESGVKRSLDLARILSQAGIKAIYTSQYLRTRQTAEPLSKQSGVPVTVVPVSMSPMNPRELSHESIQELVEAIDRHAGDNALIVGHSNTLPEIIRALGGDAVPVIDDADYDNLYIVTIIERGTAKVARLRF